MSRFWNTLMIFVAVFLTLYIVIAAIGYATFRSECERKGGVPFKTYGSGPVCLSSPAVIKIERRP